MHFKEARTILSANNGMNIFRGCTHGCIYCDSRSRCYHMSHRFDDVEVKVNAPQLLETALSKKRRKCMIATGSMCDPYIQAEDELFYTRRCLELIERYGFGLSILTKSTRIMRDAELLSRINRRSKCIVQMTLTTYDQNLCGIVEPNVSSTRERVDALKAMREIGIQTIVWLGPILPYINDTRENLMGILDYCSQAGVYGIICFGMGLTLREGSREYYYKKLDEHFPGLKAVYEREYGYSYMVPSKRSAELTELFRDECHKRKIVCDTSELFGYLSAYEENDGMKQLSFFDYGAQNK